MLEVEDGLVCADVDLKLQFAWSYAVDVLSDTTALVPMSQDIPLMLIWISLAVGVSDESVIGEGWSTLWETMTIEVKRIHSNRRELPKC